MKIRGQLFEHPVKAGHLSDRPPVGDDDELRGRESPCPRMVDSPQRAVAPPAVHARDADREPTRHFLGCERRTDQLPDTGIDADHADAGVFRQIGDVEKFRIVRVEHLMHYIRLRRISPLGRAGVPHQLIYS